ncbi:MAG: site-2 protease family protein, partial [Betaproteobacteria bacterium]
PVKHIDPIWTIAVPLLMILFKLPPIGAAKPVPVNFGALRNPKRDMIWVAAAGPLSNLAMMILWALILKLALSLPVSGPETFLALMGQAGVFVNAIIMIFNLFPLLPLDGGRIVTGLLPGRLAYAYSRTEPYGMFIVIALVVTHAIDVILFPLIEMSTNSIYAIMGISL